MDSVSARASIAFACDKYLANFPEVKNELLAGFDELLPMRGLEYAYDTFTKLLILHMGGYGHAFPGNAPAVGGVGYIDTYAASVSSTQLVDALYPGASAADKAAIVAKVNAGEVSNVDVTAGIISAVQKQSAPSAADVIKAIPHYDSLGLPAADLTLDGISSGQADFLVGVYVASFDRAPDFAGLKYWAHDLAALTSAGLTPTAGIQEIAAAMYTAGKQNGEQGGNLSNTDYVNYLYSNVLGRPADAAGLSWWVNDLDHGAARDAFLATYLSAALEHSGDATYVQSRVAVAKHVAALNRDGITIDLKTILSGVSDAATALSRIENLHSGQTRSMEIDHQDLVQLAGLGQDQQSHLAQFA